MEFEYIRDYAMYAAVLGFFSLAWFGWAQENPRKTWRKYLGIGSGMAILVCIVGVYLSITHWDAPSTLSLEGKATFIRYIIVFYAEFIIGGIGAFVLMRLKHKDWIAPWIAFVVGTHFFWLVDIFKDSSLYILAIVMIGVAFISPIVAKKYNVASSAITGIGSGTILFCFAVLGLVRYLLS
ncbi:hypothetical protein [Pseudogracilibacillus sp. SO30301A]|uniref:hypothetical protein n=1 Tax=Pseudogracilibacillus sp. SO30301A TaxID=3098291 RepID=UPI00300E16BC